MASKLRRRGKNSWQFAVSDGTTIVTGPDGRKRRRPVLRWFTIQAADAREAKRKQAEILDRLAKGTYVEPSKLTLAEFVREHFLPHLAAKKRSPATIASYRGYLEGHILPALGHLRLEQIAPIHVEQWLNTVRRRPRVPDRGEAAAPKPSRKPDLEPRTRQYLRAILHRCLQYAVEMELLARNPVAKIKPPKVVRGKPDAYSAEETAKLLDAALRYRVGALIATALYTGARLGELLALRWSDVDFAAGVITYRRTLWDPGSQREGREPHFKESTKDDEVRVIPMAPELVPILRAWRRRWVEERLAAGTEYHDRFGLVFPTETGWPQSRSNVNRELGRVVKAAGVRRLSPHGLRHTFATRLLDAGVDIDTVAELLGDDIQTVKKHYVADRPEAKKAAVQALGRLLRSHPGTAAPEATAGEAEREAASLS